MSKLDRYYPDSFYKPFLYTGHAVKFFSNKFQDQYKNTSGSRELHKLLPQFSLQKLIQRRSDWDNLQVPVPKAYLDGIGLHEQLLETFVRMDQDLYKNKIKQYFYYTEAIRGCRWHNKRFKFGRRLGGQNLLKECRNIIRENDLGHISVINNAFSMNIYPERVSYNYKYPVLSSESNYYNFTLEDHLGES